jgi:putative PIN family toxin of toxin-antitoxin system
MIEAGMLSNPSMYVFDTNVWVAALRSRQGASFVLLRAVQQRLVGGALSPALFLEYNDVLQRKPNLQSFWTTPEEVEAVLTLLADRLKHVSIHFRWRPQLRDPNDEMVLECAINANAKTIVTFNQRDFLPAAAQFGIKLVQPGELVKQLNLLERLL